MRSRGNILRSVLKFLLFSVSVEVFFAVWKSESCRSSLHKRSPASSNDRFSGETSPFAFSKIAWALMKVKWRSQHSLSDDDAMEVRSSVFTVFYGRRGGNGVMLYTTTGLVVGTLWELSRWRFPTVNIYLLADDRCERSTAGSKYTCTGITMLFLAVARTTDLAYHW